MKLSLVIPTRERSRYLRESIATAVASVDPDIEILVSDNASADDTKAVVKSFDDPRIKYVNTGRRVSMRQNFENAIDESSGDYLIMIGDDDGFLAGQIPHLKNILGERQPDVLSWKIPTFGWPVEDNGRAGVRFIRYGCYGTPTASDNTGLRRAMAISETAGLVNQPLLYHGCVRRDYLESLRGNSGEIIAGKIPDVYFTQAAIIRGGDFLHTCHPFSINGYSLASTGGVTHAYKSDDARSNPAKRFANEAEADPVQDVIPEFVKSVPFITFATLETARRELDAADFPLDYKRWYHHVLGHAVTLEEGTRQKVRALLSAYSESNGTVEDYRIAMAASRDVAARAGVLARKTERLMSFKLSALKDDECTIFTAARLMDHVLGDDYGRVLDGTLSPNKAWFRAIGRGLRYRFSR